MQSYLERLRSAFSFLKLEFGFELQKSTMDRWDRKWIPTLFYLNSTTGVRVQYDVRDEYLSVVLYRLKNGHVPERNGNIDPNEGYSLSEIVDLERTLRSERGADAINEWFPPGAPRDFESQLQRHLSALRSHAEPVLRGDSSMWPELRTNRERDARHRC